jgi:hypothetical protein
MEVSLMMAPKTSKSQVGADFCCGWGNCHIWLECTLKLVLEFDTKNEESLYIYWLNNSWYRYKSSLLLKGAQVEVGYVKDVGTM